MSGNGTAVPADGGWSNVVILLSDYGMVGYQFDAVRVTAGGVLVSITDMSRTGEGGGTHFEITIRPDGSGAPIDFEIDLGCGGRTITKHYRATLTGYGYAVIDLG